MSRAWHTLARWGLTLSLCLALPAPSASPEPATSGKTVAASAAAGASAPATPSVGAGTAPATPSASAAAASAPATPAAADQPLPQKADAQACVAGDAARAPVQACLPTGEPLSLQKTAVTTLPTAVVDQPYLYRFLASGGQPPYVFAEAGKGLPEGIALAADGSVAGTTMQRGRKTFTVELRDQSGQVLRQRYALNVTGPHVPAKPAGKSAKPSPASVPAALTPIQTLPVAAAQTPLTHRGLISTYVLTPDVLKLIHPAAPEAQAGGDGAPADPAVVVHVDASGAQAGPQPIVVAPPVVMPPDSNGLEELDEAGAAQLETLLQPLVGVEYPTRALFAAALDARVCTYAAALTDRAAVDSKQASPTAEQWRQRCADAWQGPTRPAPLPASAQVRWQDLPATLLPPRARAWLIDQARQGRNALASTAPSWSGTGCNCLVAATSGQVFGIVPNWSDPKNGPKVDFSLYERLIAFAQPFDDDGNVAPLHPDGRQLEFFRAARRYGSKVDLTVYRRDWQFLQRLPEDHQRRIAEQVAKQAVQLIDTPLAAFGRSWQDRIPGLASDKYLGDGLTLYLDQLPASGENGYAVFDAFRRRLIGAVIEEMHRAKRPLALNLMINGGDLIPALRDGNSATPGKDRPATARPASWSIAHLFDFLVKAENPRFEDGRIAAGTGGYRSATNVTLNYVLLLPEPSTYSKKVLRETVETTPELVGTNRAIFLRRLLPLISVGSAEPQQFADDMAYFNNNFGGVVLWPQPEADLKVTSSVDKAVRGTLLAGEVKESQLCNVACDWRWPLRAVFWLLLGCAVVSLLLYLTSCRVRALGRPYQLYLLAAGIVPLAIGGVLLRCDPDLATTDISTQLLIGVLVVVILSLLVPLLKPKAEKP